jgi:putative peptide zinc metalloprotease protein
MFVCSTGTLLFNANPLMKYDGYYILADWLETPNLRQKSSALVANTLSRWLAGLPGRTDPFLPNRKRWILWSYALAAAVYRVFVTIAIFWFLYRLLEPWGLKILGQILAIAAISSLVVPPLRQAYRFLSAPGSWTTVNRPRLTFATGIACLFVSLLLFLPLPHDVRCSFYLQPAGARDVFVEQPGIVTEVLARPGEQVTVGQPLLRLVNLELQAELVRVGKELAAAEAQLRLAQTWGSSDESISAQVPAARAAYEAATIQVARLQAETERLTVVAPIAGTLLPAQRRPRQAPQEMRLVQWDGQPLQAGRTGCFLEPQTKLGSITNTPGKYEAVLLVSQEDSEWINANQPVKLWLRELPSQVIRASTSNLSVQPVANIPPTLATRHGGEISTESDSQNQEVPVTPTYQVAACFSSTQQLALGGATGLGAIRVGYRTPASRLWRWFLKTFHFEL